MPETPHDDLTKERDLLRRENALLRQEIARLRAAEATYASDRADAEQQVRDVAARLSAIVNTAVDGIISIDERGTIESVNPAVVRIFGYEAHEVLGKNVSLLMPEPYHSEHDGYIRHYLDTGERKIIGVGREVSGLRKDGSTFPLELAVSETHLGDRRLFTGIVRDITERKRAEEELRRSEGRLRVLNETLEHRVRSRTEELERTNQVLEQRNRELRDFAHVASHDLREPLRKIRTFADLLEADAGDDLGTEARHHLERITVAAARMMRLLSDLLAFSRVTAEDNPFTWVELTEVAHDVLADFDLYLRETAGHVDVDPLPTIEATGAQMRQLLHNLVSNALKFHRDGDAPQVYVRAEVVDEDAVEQRGPLVRLTVEDNGIGFEDRHAERIFAPFQRLHGPDQYEGTGMGLAICRRITERHCGTIEAKGYPGKGSIFSVTLPMYQGRDATGGNVSLHLDHSVNAGDDGAGPVERDGA